jgi:hypothetical protein
MKTYTDNLSWNRYKPGSKGTEENIQFTTNDSTRTLMMDAITYTSLNKSNINNYQTILFGLEADQVFLNPSTFVSSFFNHGILIFAVLFCQVHTLVSLPGASVSC